MATEDSILRRVRLELGDQGEQFRTSYEGDGSTTGYQLPVQNVAEKDLKVFTITGSTIVDLAPTSGYTLDVRNGFLVLASALPAGTILVVEGRNYGLFSDEELGIFMHDALLQHTNGRYATVRYRTTDGFIRYSDIPMDMANLPEIEDPLLSLLTTLEALWALLTDASTDIDVITAEGTHLPRSQRWAQLMRQVDVIEDKYKELCQQLNVGLFRIEISTLRRVSYRTGRLVPLFKEREYDDNRYPIRLLPQIDAKDIDESGIPSPAYGAPYGY